MRGVVLGGSGGKTRHSRSREEKSGAEHREKGTGNGHSYLEGRKQCFKDRSERKNCERNRAGPCVGCREPASGNSELVRKRSLVGDFTRRSTFICVREKVGGRAVQLQKG